MDKLTCRNLTVSRALTYRYYISANNNSNTALLLLHGWPDDAHLFSTMLPRLRTLERRIIVPELLGYGGTSKPTDATLFSMRAMSQDLLEIIDAECIAKVIVIGHDWGSTLASRFCLFHADRCKALVQLSTPYTVPADSFDLEKINAFTEQLTGYPRLSYIEFLIQPDAPEIWEQHSDAAWTTLHGSSPTEDPQNWMTTLFCQRGAMRQFLLSDGQIPSSPPLRDYARDSELKDHWVTAIRTGSMRAPACWYHALASNVHWKGENEWAEETKSERREGESPWRLDLPVLFVGCDGDAVSSTDMQRMAAQQGLLPDLKIEEIQSGHWCPYEKPDEVAQIIREFVRDRSL